MPFFANQIAEFERVHDEYSERAVNAENFTCAFFVYVCMLILWLLLLLMAAIATATVCSFHFVMIESRLSKREPKGFQYTNRDTKPLKPHHFNILIVNVKLLYARAHKRM